MCKFESTRCRGGELEGHNATKAKARRSLGGCCCTEGGEGGADSGPCRALPEHVVWGFQRSSVAVWAVAGSGEAGTVASVCCPHCSREDQANCSTEVGAAEVVGSGRVDGLQVEGQRTSLQVGTSVSGRLQAAAACGLAYLVCPQGGVGLQREKLVDGWRWSRAQTTASAEF